MSGLRLPSDVRERLERVFGADLSAVRIHVGLGADRLARALGADAFTCGSAVFFRDGCYRPHSRAGLRLLGHEIAHVVQQAHGGASGTRWSISRPGDPAEVEADRQAERVLRGEAAPAGRTVVVSPGLSRQIQRHVSYEHRILGDGPTDDLVAACLQNDRGKQFLTDQIKLLRQWAEKPKEVTPADVTRLCPWIKTFRLGPDKVLATYGELNALPDFLPDAGSYESIGEKILLPILQVIRQEGFNALSTLLYGTDPWKRFTDSVVDPRLPTSLYAIAEVASLDGLTFGRGAEGKDHYSGILARNACHFAPHAWYRWRHYHNRARGYAQLYHVTNRAEYEEAAWIYHGYADHFLQDSFAAGHLINKTLIMQWFVEWAAARKVSIADLDILQEMTVTLQPHLSGRWLYDTGVAGPVNDPQTAQEAGTIVQRYLAGTVVSGARSDDLAAYQKYLTFVTSAAANLAAADLHDHYNTKSLWVTSAAQPKPYRVWGDFTLLSAAKGAEHVDGMRATSTAAQLSQQALKDLLATGTTRISMDQIQSHFPTGAGTEAGGVRGLRAWNEESRPFCEQIFDSTMPRLVKWLTTVTTPRLGIVSQDQRFATIWYRRLRGLLGGASAPAGLGGEETDILIWGGRVFAGSDGYVAELDPATGQVKQLRLLPSVLGQGDYTTRLATDGRSLFAGAHGYVYAVPLDDLGKTTWPARPVGGTGIFGKVNLLVDGGRLYAGSVGHVYDIDPSTGTAKSLKLASVLATTEVRLATDGVRLYAGLPQNIVAVARSDWTKPAWSQPTGNTDPNANTEVRVADFGRLYGGVRGTVFELVPATGRVSASLSLTTSVVGTDLDTRLSSDGGSLYTGFNGYLYAVRMDTAWALKWRRKTGGDDDFQRTDVRLAINTTTGNRLYIGSKGYVYDVDPETGSARDSQLLTFYDPLGLTLPTTLAADGPSMYAGVHGTAYKIISQDPGLAGNLAHDYYSGEWRGWTNGFDGAPPVQAVAAAKRENVEVFAIGQDGTVYHNWYDNRWHGWERHFRHAPLLRSITVVNGPSSLEVFGIAPDGNLYHTWYNGTWHPWEWDRSIRGARHITAVGFDDGVEALLLCREGLAYTRYRDGVRADWILSLDPGVPLSTVTAVVGPSAHLEAFATTPDGTLLHAWRDGIGWHGWTEKFDDAPPIREVTGVMGPKNLEVFAIGLDGTLCHNWFDGSWHGWERNFRGAPPRVRAVTGVKGGNLEVFLIGLDGTVYHNWYGNDWHTWTADFDNAQQQYRTVVGVLGKPNIEVFAITGGPRPSNSPERTDGTTETMPATGHPKPIVV